MTTFMIKKKKFSQLNDKGFYFLNAVVSLPFGHLSLTEIDEYKKIKVGESKSTFGLKKKNFQNLKRVRLKIAQEQTI